MSLDPVQDTNRSDDRRSVGRAGRGTNQTVMRAYNERLVLSLVRQKGALPKAEIARITGLSAQTVSVIMRALEEDGLLIKGDPVRGKVGQPSVPMGLARDGAFFLGLKVGRRGSELVLTDFLGDVKHHRRQPHDMPTPDGVVAFADQAIGDFLGDLPASHRARIAGLGIALPFRLWDWGGQAAEAGADLAAWRNRDIAAEIATGCEFPVYLCNDGTAACGAELVFGKQGKPRDFLYFYIGYFVGGGLVLDNALYGGKSGNAAALGSMIVTAQTGERRQLVDVASLVALERALQDNAQDSGAIWKRSGHWQVQGDVLHAWMEQAAQALAQAIVSATCLVDFETVLIDGSMPPDQRARLVERTTGALEALCVPGIATPKVRQGTIGYDAKALGAASLPLSDRFLVDRDVFGKG